MAIKMLCDRCGEEITPSTSATCVGMWRYRISGNEKNYELCELCAHELKLWLNGKKGENDE